MNDLDRLLAHLPADEPPMGLAEKVRKEFHRRHHRRQMAQLALSTTMVLVGAWLFTPWIAAAAGHISLPQNGLPWLQSIANLLNSGSVVNGAVEGATWMQSSLSSTLGPDHCLGLASLSIGSLLGLGSMLSGRTI